MEEEKVINNETNTTEVETKVNERTFTQDEFNDALQKAIARKSKNMPSDEELKEFNNWKESKKTEQEKLVELQANSSKKDNKIKELENTILVYNNNVNADDIDYVMYKVNKMDGDFEENLKQFIAENPKYTKSVSKITMATDINKTNTNIQKDSGVMAILKEKYPDVYKN